MNDLARWQEQNNHYLASTLAWLHLRLRRLAGPEPANSALLAVDKPEGGRSLRRLFAQRPDESLPMLPTPSDTVTEQDLNQAAAEMTTAESIDPPPALLMLAQRFGLSRFEREVLLLCAAMELDTRTARLCARAQDDPARPYPTFALALAFLDDPSWDALAPERPLRYWQMLEINQPAGQALISSALRADERVVNYLKGLNYLDDRLSPLLAPLEVSVEQESLPASQMGVVEGITRQLNSLGDMQRLPVVQLLGADGLSKQLVAQVAAQSMGLRLYRMPAELLPSQAGEMETLARLWQRESVLLPVALYLDASSIEQIAPEGPGVLVNRFLARSSGLFFLDTREMWASLSVPSLVFDIQRPTPQEQQATWQAALDSSVGEDVSQVSARLASQFNLNLPTIFDIAQRARAETPGEALHGRLWEVCLLSTRPRLDTLAQRIDPKATWEDLVLPEAEERLLNQIAAQVDQRSTVYDLWGFRHKMNRGLGISALFAGESGTGKTMAAEVIANSLRLNLYRIDLSAVVSKYIGETEKNLRRLFDAAEDGGAILFFDEADALFGKRSEVKDSHDRYANIEINYLLQRMEAYRGLAILATNMKGSLDTAFMRRLRFIVNFPFPGAEQRKAIWQRAFPAETPQEDLDYERLARLNLTGGSIHNIAVNAAFLAAQAGTPVSMPVVLAAARAEFRKLDKPVNESEFRWG